MTREHVLLVKHSFEMSSPQRKRCAASSTAAAVTRDKTESRQWVGDALFADRFCASILKRKREKNV